MARRRSTRRRAGLPVDVFALHRKFGPGGAILIVLLATMTSGCGYALAGRGSFLPADIRVVGIPLLENRTPIQRIDQVITEKVRTEFIERGRKYEIRSNAALSRTMSSPARSCALRVNVTT